MRSAYGHFGADTPAAPAAPTPDAVSALMEQKDGIYYFKPDVAKQILQQLTAAGYSTITPGSWLQSTIQLQAQTPGADSAREWVAKVTNAGSVVLAPWWISAPIDSPRYLASVPESDKAAIRQAASTPYTAVLAVPGISFMTMAVGAVVILGATALVVNHMRKRR